MKKKVKKERRSLFSKIFGDEKNTTPPSTATSFQFLNGYKPFFTNYNSQDYDSPDVRSCIDTIARNAAKLNPKHQRYGKNGYENVNDNLQRLLQFKPNELQNAYKFYYQVVSELELYNNSFVYILRDDNMRILGLYPLHYSTLKFYEYQHEIYLQFRFNRGKTRFVALKDCIHLTRFIDEEGGLMGGNSTPIFKTLTLKHIMDEGIINAIRTTQAIKGVIKSTKALLKPEDVKKMRDEFINDFINDNDGIGIGGLDASSDFFPIKLEPATATAEERKNNDEKIMSYYGINQNIIQSKFTEDEWNAFYESILEPIGLQMSLEFTNKLFSATELAHGNQIIFTSNRLQYASNSTKINLLQHANNVMQIDELREVLNLEPLPNGEGQKIMQDLNHINSQIADSYQKGES